MTDSTYGYSFPKVLGLTLTPTQTNQTVHRLTPKAWAAQAARRKAVAQTAALPV